MSIYGTFAPLYAQGSWPRYSQAMAGYFPGVLAHLQLAPQTILDVACGEGTFAVAMAGVGYQMTGVDQSAEMLRLARERAASAGVGVEFVQADMRELGFAGRFDLATCWFDSLNYLLEQADLERAFAGVCRALRPGGAFIFDMTTIYDLALNAQRFATCVPEDTDDLFAVHRLRYDWEAGISTVQITGFVRGEANWQRIDETHQQRGYRLQDIRQALAGAGFRELACWGSLRELSEVKPDSGRVWFAVERAQ